MVSSNVFTAPPIFLEPAWASPFARESWNAAADVSGSNRNQDEVRRFTLQSHAPEARDTAKKPSFILLIEDSQADAGLVREALLHHSVEGELLVIRDGDAAIRYVENIESTERCPDLVIVDLNLPKRPGREVLERMRQHPCFRHATVAIFSSSNAEQDRALAFGFRVSRYIRKPLRLDDFLNLGAVFKALLTA